MVKEKYLEIGVPETYDSGTRVIAIDNHTNLASYSSNNASGVFMVSTQSINEESNYTLSKEGILIYKDFFTSTSTDWLTPITVNFSKGGEVQNTFTIQMTKSNSSSGGFSWALTSSNGYIMDLKEGVLEPNSRGKRGDLNFTTLVFTYLVAEIPIENGSKDTAIIESIRTFRKKRF